MINKTAASAVNLLSRLLFAANPRIAWQVLRSSPPSLTSSAIIARMAEELALCHSVIDVGANCGQFARGILNATPESTRILAIEADRITSQELRDNLVHENRVDIVQAVVTAQAGPMTFYEVGALSPQSSTRRPLDSTYARIEVAGQRLDDIVCAWPRAVPPYFIKVDVQGGELGVLQGGLDTLAQSEAVLAEVLFAAEYEGSASLEEIARLLEESGYYIDRPVDCRWDDRGIAQVDILWKRRP